MAQAEDNQARSTEERLPLGTCAYIKDELDLKFESDEECSNLFIYVISQNDGKPGQEYRLKTGYGETPVDRWCGRKELEIVPSSRPEHEAEQSARNATSESASRGKSQEAMAAKVEKSMASLP